MRILLTASGTGGHLVPAIRLADALKRKLSEVEYLFVTGERGLGKELITEAGYRVETIPARGFERRRIWRNVGVFLALWKSMSICKRLLREFKPEIAIGTGGYVTGPTIRAACKAGVPTLIHEQNRLPGLTTRLLARHASIICISFEESATHIDGSAQIELTGNPIDVSGLNVTRQAAAESLGIDPNVPTILVTGGSQGADAINAAIERNLLQIFEAAGIQLVWQTGKVHFNQYQKHHQPENGIWVFPFINDLSYVLAAIDIVIARSGALTLAEITARGLPAILIPFPFAAADHQTTNAQALVNAGAAELLRDDELSETNVLGRALALLKDRQKLEEMSRESRALGRPDATELIVEHIMKLAKRAS